MNAAKTVHITISGSAAGNVRELIKERQCEQLVAVGECFSVGPLFNISEASGLCARRKYLQKIFEAIHQESVFEEVVSHIGMVDIRRLTEETARIVVWCGANADEQILLRAVCANSLDLPLMIVNICTMNSAYANRSAIGASTVEELLAAERNAVLLSADARKKLSADWENLVRRHHMLHIFLDGDVIGVDETFFDPMLTDLCPEEFGSAARLVGEVMGQSQIQIGDTFLDYRLRNLINKGIIEARNSDKQLRFMQVRRSQSSGRA